MLDRALDGDLQVVEVDRLCDEVERAPVHGGADVAHVSVGGDDHGPQVLVERPELRQQGEPVHLGHVDVREHQVDGVVGPQLLERFQAVSCELELVLAAADVSPHPLQDERLKIRLVVDDQDAPGL